MEVEDQWKLEKQEQEKPFCQQVEGTQKSDEISLRLAELDAHVQELTQELRALQKQQGHETQNPAVGGVYQGSSCSPAPLHHRGNCYSAVRSDDAPKSRPVFACIACGACRAALVIVLIGVIFAAGILLSVTVAVLSINIWYQPQYCGYLGSAVFRIQRYIGVDVPNATHPDAAIDTGVADDAA